MDITELEELAWEAILDALARADERDECKACGVQLFLLDRYELAALAHAVGLSQISALQELGSELRRLSVLLGISRGARPVLKPDRLPSLEPRLADLYAQASVKYYRRRKLPAPNGVAAVLMALCEMRLVADHLDRVGAHRLEGIREELIFLSACYETACVGGQ
jgi:hypothetical protein